MLKYPKANPTLNNYYLQGLSRFKSLILKKIMELKLNSLWYYNPWLTPRCVVHFHGHQNKMVLVMVMKLSIFVDLSNDAKFRNPICWLTNDIQRHHLPRWVNNYYIGNEDLVFSNHVEIGLC